MGPGVSASIPGKQKTSGCRTRFQYHGQHPHKCCFSMFQALKIAHSLPKGALHSLHALFYIYCFILFPLQSFQVNIIGPILRMKTSSLREIHKT